MPICMSGTTAEQHEIAGGTSTRGQEPQMSKASEVFRRIVDWLTEALERAQAHDRDRVVEQALNPRDASQRIHRLEQEPGGLQC